MTESEKKRLEMSSSNGLFAHLLTEVTNESGFSELQLTEAQRERFLEIAQRKFLNDGEFNDLEMSGSYGPKEHEEWRNRDRTICKEINREFFDEILLPHQRRILESFSMILEVQRCGHVSAFVHGDLGQKLGISDRQKQDLRRQAEESVELINSKTIQWEDEIFRKIKGAISSDSRNRLADVFGDLPSQGPANLSHMLIGDKDN